MALEPPSIKKLRGESESDDENSSTNSTLQGSTFQSEDLAPSTDSSDFTQTSHLQNAVPSNLNNWERKHLEKLNFKIIFDSSLTPLEIITKNRVVRPQTDQMSDGLLKMKLDVIEGSNFTYFLQDLERLYPSFDELRIDKQEFNWESYLDDVNLFVPTRVEFPEEFKPWVFSFHCYTKEFTRRLYDMLLRKEENCPIYESHFQFLLSSFVSALGMLCGLSFNPCLDDQVLTVGGCDVTGVPDIVFSCIRRVKSSSQTTVQSIDRVVLVCEVEKDSPHLEEKSSSPSSKTRGSKNSKRSHEGEVVTSTNAATSSTAEPDSMKKPFDLKIPDKLIGHHGGQLLFNFPNSFRQDTVLGMIVQQTQVSFTSLDMTSNTFERILKGKWKHQQVRPVLTITRPYDIFKKEDRKHLIESFIRLADYQRLQ